MTRGARGARRREERGRWPRQFACVALVLVAGCYQSHVRGGHHGVSCCEEARTPDECADAEPTCVWLEPDGCGDAPAGVITRATCVPASECHGDGECPDGPCAQYWIDPCRGMTCRACGGPEGHCAHECRSDP